MEDNGHFPFWTAMRLSIVGSAPLLNQELNDRRHVREKLFRGAEWDNSLTQHFAPMISMH
jgi:hypothetical protein